MILGNQFYIVFPLFAKSFVKRVKKTVVRNLAKENRFGV